MKLITYNFTNEEFFKFCSEFKTSGYKIYNYPNDKLDLVDCIVVSKDEYVKNCYCISSKKFHFKSNSYYLPSDFLSEGCFFSLRLVIRKIESIENEKRFFGRSVAWKVSLMIWCFMS